ncbi:MAG: hypothetical protein KKB37_17215 [Alphaproteobacteria bacterium]|nr:hypothetical protein [Alphaproteobacteria bacterium]
MKLLKIVAVLAALVALGAVAQADNANRIYGKITTVDGDVFEGLIRWDKNEASWVDQLDGTKELPDRDRDRLRRKGRNSKSRVEVFGITIAKSGDSWNWSGSAQSGIRFGHIARLEPIDDDRAMITLQSGEKIELSGGSTDLGANIREIIIEDTDEGEIELLWDDIDNIEFSSTDPSLESDFGERLYGTLTTRRGDTFTGYVTWDVDEVFNSDILDGEERDRSRKIQFDKIASIKRYSSSGATVNLQNGESLVLRGTNDVDDSNRGIIIGDPDFGQVIVDWDEFDRLDFKHPARDVSYADFKESHSLKGTVYTEDGDKFTGTIRWDDDEESTWEILDGDYRDIQFDIEFGKIKTIEKRSSRTSTVTLRDGRQFRLRGSNDVDSDNKGIFISTDGGEEVVVEWDEFSRVEFSN